MDEREHARGEDLVGEEDRARDEREAEEERLHGLRGGRRDPAARGRTGCRRAAAPEQKGGCSDRDARGGRGGEAAPRPEEREERERHRERAGGAAQRVCRLESGAVSAGPAASPGERLREVRKRGSHEDRGKDQRRHGQPGPDREEGCGRCMEPAVELREEGLPEEEDGLRQEGPAADPDLEEAEGPQGRRGSARPPAEGRAPDRHAEEHRRQGGRGGRGSRAEHRGEAAHPEDLVNDAEGSG